MLKQKIMYNKYQTGIDPQQLSQMMAMQGAGQGVDYNGQPTPNISGEPSFADMAQEIQDRYDELIIPLQEELEKIQKKLEDNPTDKTLQNEAETIEKKIDALEKQEDMELQALEQEVEKSGQMIEQQKQMEGLANNGEYVPEMEESGNIDPQMLQDAMARYDEQQGQEMPQEMPMMQLGGITKNQTAYNYKTWKEGQKKKWNEFKESDFYKNISKNIKDRPITDYLQISSRIGDLFDNRQYQNAFAAGSERMTGNPYNIDIDYLENEKNKSQKYIAREYDNAINNLIRDNKRAIMLYPQGSVASNFAFNTALNEKLNENIDKLNEQKFSKLNENNVSFINAIQNTRKNKYDYDRYNDIYNANARQSIYESINKIDNDKLARYYELNDLLSKAAQDQKDTNFIKGEYSDNYSLFSTMLSIFQLLPEEERNKLINNLKQQNNGQ